MSEYKSPAWATHIDTDMGSAIALVVSRARLSAFGFGASNESATALVALHGRNIVLCEALYPALHLLEVVLRNQIHEGFTIHFGSDRWFEQSWLKPGHSCMVMQAVEKLAKRRMSHHASHVVAELGFGFWCAMFNGTYEGRGGPWPALLTSVLPRVPKSWRTRSKIGGRLEQARELRNRVFHHDPIVQFDDLLARHRYIVEVLGWLSPDARIHLGHLSRFEAVHMDTLRLENKSPGVEHVD